MLFTTVNLTVNMDSAIPVRDQLVEQIGWQIASAILRGNDKLPSIRALAKKLGIHHATIHSVYNQLAEMGMLEIRHGSGARVVPNIGFGQSVEHSDLQSQFMQFVSKAKQLGFSYNEIKLCCHHFLQRSPVNKIVVVDRNPDFHPVILAELQSHFPVPIVVVTTEQLHADKSILKDSMVITSLYHFLSIQSLPIDPTRFMICNIEPPQEVVSALQSLLPLSIVLLVSVSPTLLQKGVNIAAGIRGESITVRTILTDDTKELTYSMRYAKAVICDLPSQDIVRKLADKISVVVFRLYSAVTIQSIQDYLKN